MEPTPHWHYVSYALSDLYGEFVDEKEQLEPGEVFYSNYGIELTLQLADPQAGQPGAEPPKWPAGLLQSIARYIFTTNNLILPGHYLNPGRAITDEAETSLEALGFLQDEKFGQIDTPVGRVVFVKVVGVSLAEMEAMMAWNTAGVMEVIEPLTLGGLTILDRKTLETDPELLAVVKQRSEAEG